MAAAYEGAEHAAAADRIMTLDAMHRDLQASRLREQRLRDQNLSLTIALASAQMLICSLIAPAHGRPE